MTKTEIVSAIRAEIERQGVSDYEIAKRSGLYKSNLQRFNSPDWGKQIETLCKIAEAVGLEVVVQSRK